MRTADEKKDEGCIVRTVKRPSSNNSNACFGHVGESIGNVILRIQVGQPVRVCPHKLEIPGDIHVNTGSILN
jgi:hypothetical protein